jgi:hypothetical protein
MPAKKFCNTDTEKDWHSMTSLLPIQSWILLKQTLRFWLPSLPDSFHSGKLVSYYMVSDFLHAAFWYDACWCAILRIVYSNIEQVAWNNTSLLLKIQKYNTQTLQLFTMNINTESQRWYNIRNIFRDCLSWSIQHLIHLLKTQWWYLKIPEDTWR